MRFISANFINRVVQRLFDCLVIVNLVCTRHLGGFTATSNFTGLFEMMLLIEEGELLKVKQSDLARGDHYQVICNSCCYRSYFRLSHCLS